MQKNDVLTCFYFKNNQIIDTMIVYFGWELDERMTGLFFSQKEEEILSFFGQQKLLNFLETHLGLKYPDDFSFLRKEQYRQLLATYLENSPSAFFSASFEADSFATAETMLQRRDELLLAGWDFLVLPDMPQRLKVFAELENILKQNASERLLHAGFADRFIKVLEVLPKRTVPVDKIILCEPLNLLPFAWTRLFDLLAQKGITVETQTIGATGNLTDLHKLQNYLRTPHQENPTLRVDGSLFLIRAKRESTVAAFFAKFLQANTDVRPTLFIPDRSRSLDNAFIHEGLPSLGILSESIARPTLQILKIVPAFVWNPVDPHKILEFVSLPVKPLRQDLASLIARVIAEKPGIRSDKWYFEIARFFGEAEEKAKETGKEDDLRKLREQYRFWFNRNRYEAGQPVPKEDFIEIFEYIRNWAQMEAEQNTTAKDTLNALKDQAQQIIQLLQTLTGKDSYLNDLQLERIIRTVYKPSSVMFREEEVGHFPYFYDNGGLVGTVPHLLWWNFTHIDSDTGFSRWYPYEFEYLTLKNTFMETIQKENQRTLYLRKQPILRTTEALWLVITDTVEGQTTSSHPLMGDIEALFGDKNLKKISIHLDTEENIHLLYEKKQGIDKIEMSVQKLGRNNPYLHLHRTERLIDTEQESYSSLESLLYYPYKWVFQHKIGLKKTSLFSVVKEDTLIGKLAHSLLENYFQEFAPSIYDLKKTEVEEWVREHSVELFEKEGSTLLLYGKEPQRVNFVNKMCLSTWSFTEIIRKNDWQIHGIEMPLEGRFMNIKITGKADLVLKNKYDEHAIIDFKWGGEISKKNLLKNGEDLQLVLYSKLLTPDDTWAHTAYYIVQKGKMIARNNLAFKEAEAITPKDDHILIYQNIWKQMENTFAWRIKQLSKGKIEIRTEENWQVLEEPTISMGELMSILEMKKENARYDDYKVLINLID